MEDPMSSINVIFYNLFIEKSWGQTRILVLKISLYYVFCDIVNFGNAKSIILLNYINKI